MDFLVNDLSLHGQFQDIVGFNAALDRLMSIRRTMARYRRELYCHRKLLGAQVTATMIMPQAVNALTPERRRAILPWITKSGPFWEDARNHPADELIECLKEVVTDTAIGEAAWCCLNGLDRGLVSVTPSRWNVSPLIADWITESDGTKPVELFNFWETAAIEAVLEAKALPPVSWDELEIDARGRFQEITLAEDAFSPLVGHPFVQSAAMRILVLLDILNQLRGSYDVNCRRTCSGNEIHRRFFTGQNAMFSDSSDTEKNRFRADMSFRHPTNHAETIFCPWHGKVQTPQFRVHFALPVPEDQSLYVVYIGPKITKR